MSQIPCPRCGQELVRPNPEQSLLSVCRCGFSGCMVDDIAAEYREEIEAERLAEPAIAVEQRTNDGTLF